MLLTAGPTFEAIDPVRGITNTSSGKMGYALAQAAAEAGATVTLVSGPTPLATPAGVTRIDVVSAAEMAAAVDANLDGVDAFVAVAAVADYTPVAPASNEDQEERRAADDHAAADRRHPRDASPRGPTRRFASASPRKPTTSSAMPTKSAAARNCR